MTAFEIEKGEPLVRRSRKMRRPLNCIAVYLHGNLNNSQLPDIIPVFRPKPLTTPAHQPGLVMRAGR